jgi:hypothetical protein
MTTISHCNITTKFDDLVALANAAKANAEAISAIAALSAGRNSYGIYVNSEPQVKAASLPGYDPYDPYGDDEDQED